MGQEIPEGVKDVTLAGVGALLYIASSPDIFDGLSESEFAILKENGPAMFELFELLGRSGKVPPNLTLPSGFGKHFADEVIPDLEKVRKDPSKQEEFRASLRGIFSKPGKLKGLYRDGGTTYSKELSDVAGSNRKGKFYGGKNAKEDSVSGIKPIIDRAIEKSGIQPTVDRSGLESGESLRSSPPSTGEITKTPAARAVDAFVRGERGRIPTDTGIMKVEKD